MNEQGILLPDYHFDFSRVDNNRVDCQFSNEYMVANSAVMDRDDAGRCAKVVGTNADNTFYLSRDGLLITGQNPLYTGHFAVVFSGYIKPGSVRVCTLAQWVFNSYGLLIYVNGGYNGSEFYDDAENLGFYIKSVVGVIPYINVPNTITQPGYYYIGIARLGTRTYVLACNGVIVGEYSASSNVSLDVVGVKRFRVMSLGYNESSVSRVLTDGRAHYVSIYNQNPVSREQLCKLTANPFIAMR
ncbi:MAG: hypothetical protein IBX56_00105 [Methylomicrobium sp.]|nr:hypothetical protein [Methylomicrobium sp.]